jgi:hypothetical protein
MIELAFTIFLNSLVNWGLGPIIATRTIAADGGALHALLCDPANQWRLATSFARVLALQPAGDRCDARLCPLFAMCVPASVRVKPSRRGRLVTSEIRVGHRTVAWATWILSPDRGTTEVDLAIQLESRSLLTRLVLLLGGRRWIARRLDTALATLAITSVRVAEDVVATLAREVVPTPNPCHTTTPRLPAEPAPIPSLIAGAAGVEHEAMAKGALLAVSGGRPDGLDRLVGSQLSRRTPLP